MEPDYLADAKAYYERAVKHSKDSEDPQELLQLAGIALDLHKALQNEELLEKQAAALQMFETANQQQGRAVNVLEDLDAKHGGPGRVRVTGEVRPPPSPDEEE